MASPIVMTSNRAGLLRPRQTRTRTSCEISGIWRIAFETDGASGWEQGVPGNRMVAVPGAWNEQLLGGLKEVGAAWYERFIDGPERRDGMCSVLRFDAASLVADVWLDGDHLGRHEGGFLPFAYDVTDRLIPGRQHRLTVRVEHGLSLERTPVGGIPAAGAFRSFPATSYDFMPMGGLIRPVRLLTLPGQAVTGIGVTTTGIVDGASIAVTVEADGFSGRANVALRGQAMPSTQVEFHDGRAVTELHWRDARLWSPADPHLETLEISLLDDDHIVDVYTQPIGVRTVSVEGSEILLNGKRIFLSGFGKHEDFPVFGRGLAEPVIVRDAELMRWVGANSYRTSHYPYAEEALEVADRAGLLVISETSAVGVNFYDEAGADDARLRYVRAELAALIERDCNHPSVIAWSVANEPFAKPIFQSTAPTTDALTRGVAFLGTLIDDAHRLDPSRPAMVVGAQGHPDEFLALGDIVAINRYYGWYTQSGEIEEGAGVFGQELDALNAKFGKPILVAEFGADTLPGCHSAESEMWSEEFQADFIDRYLDEIERRPFVAGAHVWNFADFKTSQGILRAGGLNHKGVFTRDRRPKLAAHVLRRRWTDQK
jgi:beta-glucuronidase